MRNIQTLKVKATTHQVLDINEYTWSVTSGSSGKDYEVHKHGDNYQCSCQYGTAGGKQWARKQSGCTHVMAVVAHETAKGGRKVSYHDGQEAAQKQRRPMFEVGQGLFVTSRVA